MEQENGELGLVSTPPSEEVIIATIAEPPVTGGADGDAVAAEIEVLTEEQVAREAAAEAADAAALATVEAAPKKSHKGLKITLAVIGVLLVVLGVCAFVVYQKAMAAVDSLQADGAALAADAQVLMDQAGAQDYAGALAAAQRIQVTATHMRETISTKEFDLASRIPTYGGDVLTARQLLDIVLDADANALIPLLQKLAETPLESLATAADGIDVDGIYGLLDTVDAALPVARADLEALQSLDGFAIPQLAEAVQPALDSLAGAQQTMEDATASLEEIRPLIDQLIGRDGKGAAVKLWPLIRLFLPEDADLYDIIDFFKSFGSLAE